MPLLVEKENWSLRFEMVGKDIKIFVGEREGERALTEKEAEK